MPDSIQLGEHSMSSGMDGISYITATGKAASTSVTSAEARQVEINFDVISTGKLVEADGHYKNIFVGDTDQTDYARYVLTLEPDDGDPAPAKDHIVEGDLKK